MTQYIPLQCADVASGRARGSTSGTLSFSSSSSSSSSSKSRPSQSSSSSSSGGGGGSQGDPCVSVEKAREYLAAARQVENVICTSRESLLGSSAWRQEFLAQLKSRPFYFVTDLPHHLCEVFITLSLFLTSHFLFILIAFSLLMPMTLF